MSVFTTNAVLKTTEDALTAPEPQDISEADFAALMQTERLGGSWSVYCQPCGTTHELYALPDFRMKDGNTTIGEWYTPANGQPAICNLCMMELAQMRVSRYRLLKDVFGYHPKHVSRTVTRFSFCLNDFLGDGQAADAKRLELLAPLMDAVAFSSEGDTSNTYWLADYLCRTLLPEVMDKAGLLEQAERLRGLKQVTNRKTARAARYAARAAHYADADAADAAAAAADAARAARYADDAVAAADAAAAAAAAGCLAHSAKALEWPNDRLTKEIVFVLAGFQKNGNVNFCPTMAATHPQFAAALGL